MKTSGAEEEKKYRETAYKFGLGWDWRKIRTTYLF